MNYYPFHLGDYAAHTAHLEPMEDLAYRRMLDLYYRTEAPLSSDWRDIARLIRMKDQGAAIEAVLSEFFTLTADGWTHARCDAEILRMQDKQTKAKASAQASVNARSTNAQRTLNERSTAVELPTPTPTPTPEEQDISPPSGAHPPAGGLSGRFGDFWLAWPKGDRKQDKAKCEDYWKRHKLAEVAPAILADVRAKRGTPKWADGFIEAPLTYLRGRRWEDGGDVGPEVAPANTTPSAEADKTAAALAADARRFEAVKANPEEQARIAETIQRARQALKAVA